MSRKENSKTRARHHEEDINVLYNSHLDSSKNNAEAENSNEQEPLPLAQIRYRAYQLQGISEPGVVNRLANSHYDMLVLEPTRTDWSSDDRYFDKGEMAERLKNTKSHDGIHRKLIISYKDNAN